MAVMCLPDKFFQHVDFNDTLTLHFTQSLTFRCTNPNAIKKASGEPLPNNQTFAENAEWGPGKPQLSHFAFIFASTVPSGGDSVPLLGGHVIHVGSTGIEELLAELIAKAFLGDRDLRRALHTLRSLFEEILKNDKISLAAGVKDFINLLLAIEAGFDELGLNGQRD